MLCHRNRQRKSSKTDFDAKHSKNITFRRSALLMLNVDTEDRRELGNGRKYGRMDNRLYCTVKISDDR